MKDIVKIELSPYNALTLLSFMREFVNESNTDDYRLNAIHEAVNQYEKSMTKNITLDQIDDAKVENQVNQLIGKSPTR
jgi:hypothetical protein